MGKPFYPITHGKDDEPTSCQVNAEAWLQAQGHAAQLCFDGFTQRLMLGSAEVTDHTVVQFISEMEAESKIAWSEQHLRNALMRLGYSHKRSSLTAWLDTLSWDGTPRLDQFFIDVCGATDDAYSRACARVMFLSAVARAYRPGCQADVMVILMGKQGIGKSKSLISLVPQESWFTDDLGGDLHDRRAAESLQGKWMVEFGEFARINRATVEMVKAYVSRRTDRYRPPWGRMAQDYPRQCIFIGTTNNRQPLQDLENRRFMPLWCPQFFIDVTPEDRDQLWAEAVERYRKSESWWLTDKALIDASQEAQEDARQVDTWEELLSKALAGNVVTTMSDMADHLGIKPDRLDKPTQTRLGLVMQALGFRRRQVRLGFRRSYEYRREP